MNKENQKKKTKFLTMLNTILFLMLIGFLAVPIYGYWANRKVETDNTVTIGHGDELEATLHISVTDKLVPAGFAVGNQVEEVIYEYKIKWTSEDELSQNGILSVSVDIPYNPHNLVNININPSTQVIVLNGSEVIVTLTITLTEPADENQYNDIKGLPITFNITFEVTPTSG